MKRGCHSHLAEAAVMVMEAEAEAKTAGWAVKVVEKGGSVVAGAWVSHLAKQSPSLSSCSMCQCSNTLKTL